MAGSNHKDFDNKKDALAFLKKNALMSVGWPEGKEQKVAIYWNGRLHIEKSTTKKIWGAMNRQKIAQELVAVARELTGGMMKRWLEDISVEMGLDGEITKAVMKEAEKRMKKLNVKKGSREMTGADPERDRKEFDRLALDAYQQVARAHDRMNDAYVSVKQTLALAYLMDTRKPLEIKRLLSRISRVRDEIHDVRDEVGGTVRLR